MTANTSADPLELFQISKELFAAQQKFLPSGQVYAQLAEVMRSMTQANISYAQALMRANAGLLAAFVERPGGTEPGDTREERPSVAAHRPDVAAA